jgi:hypothetical protein
MKHTLLALPAAHRCGNGGEQPLPPTCCTDSPRPLPPPLPVSNWNADSLIRSGLKSTSHTCASSPTAATMRKPTGASGDELLVFQAQRRPGAKLRPDLRGSTRSRMTCGRAAAKDEHERRPHHVQLLPAGRQPGALRQHARAEAGMPASARASPAANTSGPSTSFDIYVSDLKGNIRRSSPNEPGLRC